MRHSRAPQGPPSTLSSSSGHGLVYGTHKPRAPQLAFTPESAESVPAKKKTKLIVIFGIALPVLACVIGIAAWAVTTDVLRITPRANDNNYNRFGHQGKTRIDTMQSRSDDVDVFVLHGITTPTSPSQGSSTKKVLSSTTASTTGSSITTRQAIPSPKASDILSKLISDMPPPKHPKNFVVFAPIPDDGNMENQRKGRRLDLKVIHHDGEDLVAEESVISEDTSQELRMSKTHFNRKRKPTVSNYSLKPGMGPPPREKIQKVKQTRNPRILQDHVSTQHMDLGGPPNESPPNFIKRPQRGEFISFPPNSKPSVNSISNRNGGITIPNGNFLRNNFPNSQPNNVNGFQKNNAKGQQLFRNPSSSFDNVKPMPLSHSFPPNNFQAPAPSLFDNKDNPPQFQMKGPSNIQNKELNMQPNQYQPDNQRSLQFQNQHKVEPSQNQFLPSKAPSLFTKDNPSHFQIMNPSNIQNSEPNMQMNQFAHENQRLPSFQNQHKTEPSQNQFHPPQPASAPQPNYSNSPQNTFSRENSPMSSGGPQYFAPPPQTFHTKMNYDQPASKFPSSPSAISSYEKVAQGSVDPSVTDGTHHHHHHHHHHEPVASNSDPIGDVNFSDVPRNNDADRLGSVGIGLGPSRGITLQLGGGGLGGLLPLGTLGIARSIVSALLPRPQLGLNSKVFMGVEVGRGGGFSLG